VIYWFRPWSFLPNSQVYTFISLGPGLPVSRPLNWGIGTNGLASFLGGKTPER
jgi:hypothetical protein